MTLVYLGGLSVGDAIPGAALAVDAGIAGISPGLANLQAQVAALASWTPAPISFAAQITIATDLISSLNAAIGLGLTPPTMSEQIAMISAKISELTSITAGIEAQLAVLTGLQTPLGAAGVHGYAFDGDTDDLGSELDGELAGGVPGGSGSDHANAVVLITTIPATWAALGEIVKVEP